MDAKAEQKVDEKFQIQKNWVEDRGKLQLFRQKLISWGIKNFRNYPWRKTRDPYHLLMAEVMLHRTQAFQVVSVYEQFIRRYPNLPTLAQSSKEELHDILYSIGLRWRIDLIHTMTAELMERYNGQVPRKKDDLLSLSGVSQYIASAVRCFTWNLPEPLIDTNTVRVVGRLFEIEIKDSSRRNRRFRELLMAMVDLVEPRSYNYALLDLAGLVCLNRLPPECFRCPLQDYCVFSAAASTAPDFNRSN